MHRHIVHVIPNLDVGGAATMLLQLVQSLGAPFFNHTIITLQNGGRLLEAAREAGAKVTELGMPEGVPNVAGMTKLLMDAVNEPTNVLQGWRYHGNMVAQAMRAVMRPPPGILWSIHATEPEADGPELKEPRIITMNAMLSSRADAIVFVSDASMAAHATLGFDSSKFIKIPSGIDTGIFAAKADAKHRLRVRLGLPPATPLIGFVAPLRLPKDPATFFAAVQCMGDTNAQFVLMGEELNTIPAPFDAQLSPEMKARVHCLGLQKDAANVLRGLTVVTRSARTEALPRTLLEAMACQTLCVATDAGDVKSLLEGVGWVVPVGDAPALAQAWRQALTCDANEAQQRLDAGRARISQAYSAQAMATAFSEHYMRLGSV